MSYSTTLTPPLGSDPPDSQDLVGGKLVLVEREADRAKLLEFYNANGFKSWNGRYDKKDQVQYDQMIRVLESVA